MKTINLTDDQFYTLFEFVNQKVESIVDASVDYQDSEILEDWEDLFDVHTVLETVDNWSQQPLNCNPIEYSNKMENYLTLFEHIPEDEHNHISNKIWEALDRAGI